jgi:hypothetical protein
MPHSVFFQMSHETGVVPTLTYDCVDQNGYYVFQQLTGTKLLTGLTISVSDGTRTYQVSNTPLVGTWSTINPYIPGYNSPQIYYQMAARFTIDHTQVIEQNTYTIPITITNTSLKFHIYGGTINNFGSVNGTPVPIDLVFSSDLSGTASSWTFNNYLKWDIKSYSTTNGTLTAHVRLDNLSTTSDTTFYMLWGSTLNSFTGGSIGTAWDDKFRAVWPLGDAPPSHLNLNMNDYSSYGNNLGSPGYVGVTSGVWDGAAYFTGATNSYINITESGNSISPTTPGTNLVITCLAYVDSSISHTSPVFFSHQSGGPAFYAGPGLTYATSKYLEFALSGVTNTGSSEAYTGFYTDRWYHFSVDYSINNYVKLYIDGSLVRNIGFSHSPTYGSNPQIGWSGTETDPSNYLMGGKIEELHISVGSRGDNWIQTMYNAYKPESTFSTGIIL